MVNKQELYKALSDAVSAIISFAQDNGIDSALPSDNYDVLIVQPTAPGSTSGMYERRQQPSFELLWRNIGSQIEELPVVRRLDSLAREFAEQEGKFVAMIGQPPSVMESLLREYFNRAAELKQDAEVLGQVSSEFMNDLQSPTMVVKSVYWLENFEAQSAFKLDSEVNFRPITNQDIDIYARAPTTPFQEQLSLTQNDWLCEIRQESPKTTEVYNRQHEVMEQISVALHLTKEGNARSMLLEKRLVSPFLSSARGSRGLAISTSGIGGRIVLDESDVTTAVSIYEKVKLISSNSRYKHLRLPFRRLRAASVRRAQEDMFVDYVIALESLLASDTPQLESTFRFRLRGAALLPDSFGSPSKKIRLMNSLYRVRSNVVHGEAKQQDVAELLPEAEKALRSIFIWYMENTATLGDTKKVLPQLDEAMVAGGQAWAQSGQSPLV